MEKNDNSIDNWKVLFLTDDLLNGGAQRQLILLFKNLPIYWRRCICSLNGGEFLNDLLDTSLPFYVFKRKWRFDVFPALRFWKFIYYWKPDIIHTWGWITTLLAIPICKLLQIPLVIGVIRGVAPYYYRGSFTKYLIPWGDIIISNSKAGLVYWGVNQQKGRYVYNGFAQGRLNSNNEIYIEKSIDEFNVIMAARMVPVKDYKTCIDTFGYLENKGYTNLLFSAVGEGCDKEFLQGYAKDLIDKGIVKFLETSIEIIQYIKQSDVGVLLNNPAYGTEGCSNTILEYMACGLPIICSDTGGNSEIVENGVTGFLIPVFDIQALAEKILWLYENPEEAKKMGEIGKEKVLNNFSVSRMVEKTVEIYEELI